MSYPNTIKETPNWVIVNTLKCPIEDQISIVAKLLEHLDKDEQEKALTLAGIIKSVCEHEFVSKEYSSQNYGTCLSCKKTIFT